MKNLDLYQIALEPGATTELERAALYMNHRQHLKPRQRFKLSIGRALHPFGIHHWVVWRTWDRASNRILTMGETCAFCALGRLV